MVITVDKVKDVILSLRGNSEMLAFAAANKGQKWSPAQDHPIFLNPQGSICIHLSSKQALSYSTSTVRSKAGGGLTGLPRGFW